jgi:DNA-binding transcriptional LysR family regulator
MEGVRHGRYLDLHRSINQYPKIINIFFKMMKINRIDDLNVFVRAAQLGSFSDAARDLGISPVVASAIIKRLEAALGVRLFERSTRRVRLSDAGERLLPHAREALQALAWGEAALGQAPAHDGRLQGLLRLSMPSDLGRSVMLDWIEQFIAKQGPGAALMLELRISDRITHLLQHSVDFALRYGRPEDSGLIALPIAPRNRRLLVAAPAYLARCGTPRQPQDLLQHNCLRFVVNDVVHGRWRFVPRAGLLADASASDESKPTTAADVADVANAADMVEVQGDRVADDGGIVRQWALAGLGIASKSALDVAGDIASGRLVRLLPDYLGEATPLYLVVVSKQHLQDGVRSLCAELARQCQALLQRIDAD